MTITLALIVISATGCSSETIPENRTESNNTSKIERNGTEEGRRIEGTEDARKSEMEEDNQIAEKNEEIEETIKVEVNDEMEKDVEKTNIEDTFEKQEILKKLTELSQTEKEAYLKDLKEAGAITEEQAKMLMERQPR